MRTSMIFMLATAAAMLPITRAHAQVTTSAGADYASGTYGTGQRIKTATASIAVQAKRKRLTVFATLPVVRTDAPGNVVVTGGPLGLPILVDPTRPATRIRRSGLGDASVGASVQLLEAQAGHVSLAIAGAAKLPTASAMKGLGTGRADVSVAADAARTGKITPFVGIGYTVVGQPDAYRLNNVASARGGIAVRIGKASAVSVSYNYASRVSDTISDRREIGAGVETALSQRLSLGVHGSAGLSRGAPDAGAGLRLGLRM